MASEPGLSAERAQILRTFDGQPEGLQIVDISRMTKLSDKRVRGILIRLEKYGQVEWTGHEHWWRRTRIGEEALAAFSAEPAAQGPSYDRPLSPDRVLVLRAFNGGVDGLTVEAVVKSSQLPRDRVDDLMNRMFRRGYLEKLRTVGWWRRTDAGADILQQNEIAETLSGRARRPVSRKTEPRPEASDLTEALQRIETLEAALTPFVLCALALVPPVEEIVTDVWSDRDPVSSGQPKLAMITPPIAALRAALKAMPHIPAPQEGRQNG